MLQTNRNPRKEPDRHRSTRPSIYQHRATAPITKKPPPPPPPPPVTSTLTIPQPKIASSASVISTSVLATNPAFQPNKPNMSNVPLKKGDYFRRTKNDNSYSKCLTFEFFENTSQLNDVKVVFWFCFIIVECCA